LLEGFLRLDPPDPERVAAYARQYGPLYLCASHRLPLPHELAGTPPGGEAISTIDASNQTGALADKFERATARLDGLAQYQRESARCAGLETLDSVPGRPRMYREPLQVWGAYARQARAILALAAGLHRDEMGTLEHWRMALDVSSNAALPWSWTSDTERQQVVRASRATDWYFQWLKLFEVIQRWLDRGGVRLTATPNVEMDARGRWLVTPVPKIHSPWGLFGNLAMQLLFAACRATGWLICANAGSGAPKCQEIYSPKRPPPRGQPSWCAGCRDREHSRVWYATRGRKLRKQQRRRARRAIPPQRQPK
jgi:hypothetical protein